MGTNSPKRDIITDFIIHSRNILAFSISKHIERFVPYF